MIYGTYLPKTSTPTNSMNIPSVDLSEIAVKKKSVDPSHELSDISLATKLDQLKQKLRENFRQPEEIKEKNAATDPVSIQIFCMLNCKIIHILIFNFKQRRTTLWMKLKQLLHLFEKRLLLQL